MANQLQLQRQIQEEIDREAMFEEKLNKCFKQFLRGNKQFYQVNQIEGCHAVLIYKKELPLKVDLRIYDPENPINEIFFSSPYFLFFLKYKNKHASISHEKTYIKERRSFRTNNFQTFNQ